MKIVCATSLTHGYEAFSTMGDVELVPDKSITADVARDADLLVVRSKTRVGPALLDGSKVAFVGTATAGTDHMDLDYLDQRRIGWASAAGSNANSVAEYVVAALLCLAVRHRFALQGRTIAVIGVGHVGKLVAKKAEALGLRVLLNDPPLFIETGDARFQPLDEILPQADIVSLHVPLLDHDPFPTRRMVHARFFEQLQPGAIFVNAARGEIADSDSVLRALDAGIIRHAVLDVFENEPSGPYALLASADLITPHIAGYSHQGKVNGTCMIYREACSFFEIAPVWTPPRAVGLPPICVEAAGRSDEAILAEVVGRAYSIEADDAALRAGLSNDADARGRHFEKLRAEYPVRHEFNQRVARIGGASPTLSRRVAALGFQSLEKRV